MCQMKALPMTTPPEYEVKKKTCDDIIAPDQLYDLTDIPEFLFRIKKQQEKKSSIKKTLAKRLSPFLLVAVCLPALFIYIICNNKNDKWFLLFLLVFIEINMLLMDFALWNYYEGRKKAMIWIIETALIIIASYTLFQL